jgi:hypothetical protein
VRLSLIEKMFTAMTHSPRRNRGVSILPEVIAEYELGMTCLGRVLCVRRDSLLLSYPEDVGVLFGPDRDVLDRLVAEHNSAIYSLAPPELAEVLEVFRLVYREIATMHCCVALGNFRDDPFAPVAAIG